MHCPTVTKTPSISMLNIANLCFPPTPKSHQHPASSHHSPQTPPLPFQLIRRTTELPQPQNPHATEINRNDPPGVCYWKLRAVENVLVEDCLCAQWIQEATVGCVRAGIIVGKGKWQVEEVSCIKWAVRGKERVIGGFWEEAGVGQEVRLSGMLRMGVGMCSYNQKDDWNF